MSNCPTEEGSITKVVRDHTVYVEWEIPEFFELRKECRALLSPSFFLCDLEYFIRIGANALGDVYITLGKKLRIFRELHVLLTVGVKTGHYSIFKSCSKIKGLKDGNFPYSPDLLVTKSELFDSQNPVAPNGVLTVFVTACMLYPTQEAGAVAIACQPPSEGLNTLSKNFKQLFLTGEEGDVTFAVKDKKFLAHKLVLAARSTVFQRMFRTDMVEKNNGTVDISDSDPDHFEHFLLYLYSGELNFVSSSSAFGLYRLADKYNLQELKQTCCECLIREINVDSFCDTAILAYLHDETKLMKTVTEFFIKHAKEIFPIPKWTSFMGEYLTFANELLNKMANERLN